MKDLFTDRILSTTKQIKAKKRIFEAGRSANRIFYLESGLVKQERINEEGKEVITFVAREGEYVALAALFSKTYRCTAVALADCIFRTYPKEEALSVMKNDQSLSIKLIELLSRKVHELREQVEILNVQSAEERILVFLKAKSSNGIFDLPKDLKNLAAQLGFTQETLYRKLKQLEEQNLIKREERRIILV